MNISAILSLCIVALAAALPMPEEVSDETKTMAAQHSECFDQTGITLEQLEKLTKSPTANMPKSSMCYLKCVAEELGVEIDGVLQKEATVAIRPDGLSEEDARKIVEECSELGADDPCEQAFTRYLYVFEKGGRRPWLKAH